MLRLGDYADGNWFLFASARRAVGRPGWSRQTSSNTVRRCTETCAWERSSAAFGADTAAGVGGTWSRSHASRSEPLSGG